MQRQAGGGVQRKGVDSRDGGMRGEARRGVEVEVRSTFYAGAGCGRAKEVRMDYRRGGLGWRWTTGDELHATAGWEEESTTSDCPRKKLRRTG